MWIPKLRHWEGQLVKTDGRGSRKLERNSCPWPFNSTCAFIISDIRHSKYFVYKFGNDIIRYSTAVHRLKTLETMIWSSLSVAAAVAAAVAVLRTNVIAGSPRCWASDHFPPYIRVERWRVINSCVTCFGQVNDPSSGSMTRQCSRYEIVIAVSQP